jgi:hypothetical protein
MRIQRSYSVTFEGRALLIEPITYPTSIWILAKLLRFKLPVNRAISQVAHHFTIQGPNEAFVHDESEHRIAYYMERYTKVDPEARVSGMNEGPAVPHLDPQATLDLTPGQSDLYKDWMTTQRRGTNETRS